MPQPAQPAATPTPVAPSALGKVWLIDNGDAVREVIRTFLQNRGIQVCGEAADGVDAIEKAKALKPDLIIIDLAMPRMNGMEAASILSRILPRVPIVLLTIYGDSWVRRLRRPAESKQSFPKRTAWTNWLSVFSLCSRKLVNFPH